MGQNSTKKEEENRRKIGKPDNPYLKDYVPPDGEDFETNYNCPNCKKDVECKFGRIFKNGDRWYRHCPDCQHLDIVHFAPRTKEIMKYGSECCESDCDCDDFRKIDDSGTCECGHLGSYHKVLPGVLTGYEYLEPWTNKDALKVN